MIPIRNKEQVDLVFFNIKQEYKLLKTIRPKIPCSNGHRAGSSPKYWAKASAFLPWKHWNSDICVVMLKYHLANIH